MAKLKKLIPVPREGKSAALDAVHTVSSLLDTDIQILTGRGDYLLAEKLRHILDIELEHVIHRRLRAWKRPHSAPAASESTIQKSHSDYLGASFDQFRSKIGDLNSTKDNARFKLLLELDELHGGLKTLRPRVPISGLVKLRDMQDEEARLVSIQDYGGAEVVKRRRQGLEVREIRKSHEQGIILINTKMNRIKQKLQKL
jgi:hypothetical protein